MTYHCLSTYCIDDISCSSQYIIEKVQIQSFQTTKFPFFSIFWSNIWVRNWFPIFFVSLCSLFNSASNHISDIVPKRFKLRKPDLKIDHSHHILLILSIISYSSLGIFLHNILSFQLKNYQNRVEHPVFLKTNNGNASIEYEKKTLHLSIIAVKSRKKI